MTRKDQIVRLKGEFLLHRVILVQGYWALTERLNTSAECAPHQPEWHHVLEIVWRRAPKEKKE